MNFARYLSVSDSGGIQTHNLLIRSQMLYSVELRNLLWLPVLRLMNKFKCRFLFCECKGRLFFSNHQIFSKLFSKKVSFRLKFGLKSIIFRPKL